MHKSTATPFSCYLRTVTRPAKIKIYDHLIILTARRLRAAYQMMSVVTNWCTNSKRYSNRTRRLEICKL